MYFEELRLLLLERIRRSVYNGELTERGLARLIGISQPHVHNILKGTRTLSDEVADRILYSLHLSVLDLCDPAEFHRYAPVNNPATTLAYSHIPILRGKIGPMEGWPEMVEPNSRFPVPAKLVVGMRHPVVCRLGRDDAMRPVFSEGDLALLDQSVTARTELVQDGLYLVKREQHGFIRYAAQHDGKTCIYTHATRDQKTEWQPIPLDYLGLEHYIRARVVLVAAESEWV